MEVVVTGSSAARKVDKLGSAAGKKKGGPVNRDLEVFLGGLIGAYGENDVPAADEGQLGGAFVEAGYSHHVS